MAPSKPFPASRRAPAWTQRPVPAVLRAALALAVLLACSPEPADSSDELEDSHLLLPGEATAIRTRADGAPQPGSPTRRGALQIAAMPIAHQSKRTAAIDTIVLHYASAGEADQAHRFDPAWVWAVFDHYGVSAHYLLPRTGNQVLELVPEERKAAHVGPHNARSIGIELIGTETMRFTDRQYELLAALVADIAKRHPITAIYGHQELMPEERTDPGPCFDWSRVLAALPAGAAARSCTGCELLRSARKPLSTCHEPLPR